jgi:hypothetical protein
MTVYTRRASAALAGDISPPNADLIALGRSEIDRLTRFVATIASQVCDHEHGLTRYECKPLCQSCKANVLLNELSLE